MILLVDGRDNPNRPGYIKLSKAVQPLKDKDVKILAVGATPNADKNQLTQIASSPRYIFMVLPANLAAETPRIINTKFDYLRETRQPKGIILQNSFRIDGFMAAMLDEFSLFRYIIQYGRQAFRYFNLLGMIANHQFIEHISYAF